MLNAHLILFWSKVDPPQGWDYGLIIKVHALHIGNWVWSPEPMWKLCSWWHTLLITWWRARDGMSPAALLVSQSTLIGQIQARERLCLEIYVCSQECHTCLSSVHTHERDRERETEKRQKKGQKSRHKDRRRYFNSAKLSAKSNPSWYLEGSPMTLNQRHLSNSPWTLDSH